MRQERPDVIFREIETSSLDLGKSFVHRWFTPRAIKEQGIDFVYIGDTLKTIGSTFRRGFGFSVFNLYDLTRDTHNKWLGGNFRLFEEMWARILAHINHEALRYPVKTTVPVSEYDLLVTTPIAKAKEHAREAEQVRQYYKKTGLLDYYWRAYVFPPSNLRVGSSVYYVDRRAIRGFAMVTDIVLKDFILQAHMLADTWRWITPIPCDYRVIKPPQSYARANRHKYFAGIAEVQVIGGWLDPMPESDLKTGCGASLSVRSQKG